MSNKNLSRRAMRANLFATASFALVIGLVGLSSPAQADTANWKGYLLSSNWSRGASWSTGVAPNSSSTDVVINDSFYKTVTLNQNASIRNLTIGSDSTLNITDTKALSVYGTAINLASSALLKVDGTLNLMNDVTLTGGNVTLLEGANVAYIRAANNTFTNNSTIAWSGDIDAKNFVNNGTVTAKVGDININASGGTVTNNGTLAASTAGDLYLNSTIYNANGIIKAEGSGNVYLNGGTNIIGGTLSSEGADLIFKTYGMFTNGSPVTLNGVTLAKGTTLESSDNDVINIVNGITINGGGGKDTYLYLSTDTSLTTGGTIQLNTASGGGAAHIRNIGTTSTLTNVDNTIQGNGFIGDGNHDLNFVNASGGTIHANGGGELNIGAAGGAFTNYGTVKVDAGSKLEVTGNSNGYVQNGGNTRVDGLLVTEHGMDINGGTLQGTGKVVGDVTNASTVHPGNSVGILTIDGDYAQTSTGVLDFTITSTGTPGVDYSQLQIEHGASLDGTLAVTTDTSLLSIGDTFTLLTFARGAVGNFDNLLLNGSACSAGSLSGNTMNWSCSLTAATIYFQGI
ncbi:MAG: hypothetical protein WC464_05910, partial [Bdellovibrionales bacterium]